MDYVPTIPESLASRLRWFDGFHASAELKGNPILDNLLARYSEQTGSLIVPCEWYSPSEFEQKFGIRYSKFASDGNRDRPWVETYVMDLLNRALQKKVSDIHITYMGPYAQVYFRRMGLLQEDEPLNGEEGKALIRGIFQGVFSQAESGFTEFERYDGRIADRKFLPEGLFAVRLHSEPIQSPLISSPGITLAMRLLYDATSATGPVTQRLASLGFTPEQQNLVNSFTERSGLTIVSGPTGHGKTTVLKNIMEALAQYVPTKNYYSLEDPPEYTILGVRQLNVVTKAISDAERERALLEALAGLMRSDPDVILLGEIRYLEAARAAINAALTGHGVWSTVHANSAIGIVARLHEMGVPLESICTDGVLNGLMYQRLMPILCPECKKPLHEHPAVLSPDLWERLKAVYTHGEIDNIHIRGDGCPHCDGLGLVGQQVAAEVIPAADRELIGLLRKNRLYEAQQHWIKDMGGMTHVSHALARIASGEVDPAIAEERLGVTLDHDLAFSMKPEARSRTFQLRRPALWRPRRHLWRAA